MAIKSVDLETVSYDISVCGAEGELQRIRFSYGTQPSSAEFRIPDWTTAEHEDESLWLPPKGLKNVGDIDIALGTLVNIAIKKKEVFEGYVTDISRDISESGKWFNIIAMDPRIQLKGVPIVGEYNNDNDFTTLPPSATANQKPHWSAKHIIGDILMQIAHAKAPTSIGGVMFPTNIEGIFGTEEIVTGGAIDPGHIRFDGQDALQSLMTIVQALGNFDLYYSVAHKNMIIIIQRGQSENRITLKFGTGDKPAKKANVISSNLTTSVKSVYTAILVRGLAKETFSEQQRIGGYFHTNQSDGFVGGGEFIVGKELTPDWTLGVINPDAKKAAALLSLREPRGKIRVPGSENFFQPIVIDSAAQLQVADDGRTVIGGGGRPMEVAEAIFFGSQYLPHSPFYPSSLEGMMQVWGAFGRDIDTGKWQRMGQWSENLADGRTDYTYWDGTSWQPVFTKNRELYTGGEFFQKDITIPIDILVEDLYCPEGPGGYPQITIRRPSKDEYTIDRKVGRVKFKDPASIIPVVPKYVFVPREMYSGITNRNHVLFWHNREYTAISLSGGDAAMKISTINLPFKYTNNYWIPRVWATFYHHKIVHPWKLTWEEGVVRNLSGKAMTIYKAKEDNVVLIVLNEAMEAGFPMRVKSYFIEKKWRSGAEKGEIARCSVAGESVADLRPSSTSVEIITQEFKHIDEREEMAELGAYSLIESNSSMLTQSITIRGDASIGAGMDLGTVVINKVDFFAASAEHTFPEGFKTTLELTYEKFYPGRTPDRERRTIVAQKHGLAKLKNLNFPAIPSSDSHRSHSGTKMTFKDKQDRLGWSWR